jgi:uncharacterized membrane protein YccC
MKMNRTTTSRTMQPARQDDRALARAALARLTLVALLAAGCVSLCWAQSNATQENVPSSEVGHATRTWLELQRSNAAAAPARPMLGAEAGLAYKRYMESFNSKIPDVYSSMMSQGGGSAGGAQSGTLPQN